MNKIKLKEFIVIFILSAILTYFYIWWIVNSTVWKLAAGFHTYPGILRPFSFFVWWYPFKIFFTIFLSTSAAVFLIKNARLIIFKFSSIRNKSLFHFYILLAFTALLVVASVFIVGKRLGVLPTTIKPDTWQKPTLSLNDLPPKGSRSISAVYSGSWFGPCGKWRITYDINNETDYNRREQICIDNPSLSSRKEGLARTQLEKNIFIQTFLQLQKEGFTEIGTGEIPVSFVLHPEALQCWTNQNRNEFICANSKGVIVEHFRPYTEGGPTDINFRYTLEEFKEIASENYCKTYRDKISNYLDRANYCSQGTDCLITGFGCPFGCYNLVNKTIDLKPVEMAHEDYSKVCGLCLYDCDRAPKQSEVICRNNRCVDIRYQK